MEISWVIEGTHSGHETAESVDGAAEALTAGVRQAYSDHETGTLAHLMLNVVTPLRLQIVSEGKAAVERGETWEGSAGEVVVTLSPGSTG